MEERPRPSRSGGIMRSEPDGRRAQPVIGALRPWGRTGVEVASLVPRFPGFHDRVVQVLHPWWGPDRAEAYGTDRVPVTWATVAERLGIRRSELWPCPTESEFPDVAAEQFGTPQPWIDEAGRDTLIDLLAPATTTPDDIAYLIWEGWGVDWPGAATVELEHRPCVLLTGPLAAFPTSGTWSEDDPVQICWPRDRAWAVAGDTDLFFTYVAGPAPLLHAIHADPRLETGLVGWDDVTSIAG